jgi:hypothetical protein
VVGVGALQGERNFGGGWLAVGLAEGSRDDLNGLSGWGYTPTRQTSCIILPPPRPGLNIRQRRRLTGAVPSSAQLTSASPQFISLSTSRGPRLAEKPTDYLVTASMELRRMRGLTSPLTCIFVGFSASPRPQLTNPTTVAYPNPPASDGLFRSP